MSNPRFTFGQFVYDVSTATLWRDATLVPLGGRAAAVLQALLEAGDRVVPKGELIDRAWSDTIVEDGNLAVQIATLRKTLGTKADGEEWISTIARVGYRFVRDGPNIADSRKPLLAVLPFQNMSGSRAQDYLADGLAEDLITALSRLSAFGVVARQSSFIYRQRPRDIRDIARALRVQYLIDGSVQRSGNRIRVTAQLIEGMAGTHLWADTVDGRLDHIFDFHDRVTARVVELVEPTIRKMEIERARRKRPDSADAYDLYLQGLWNFMGVPPRGPDSYAMAIEKFDKAIELDPGFVPALTYAAWVREKRYGRSGSSPDSRDAEEALKLAERAYAGDPNNAMAVLVAGVVNLTIRNDSETGIALMRRAGTLNPYCPIIQNTTGFGHMFRGEVEQAISCYQHSLRMTGPSAESFWAAHGLAWAHLSAGHFEAALTWSLRAKELSGDLDATHCALAAAYAHLGQLEKARECVAAACKLTPSLTIEALLGPKGRPDGIDRYLVEGLVKAGLGNGSS